MERPIAGSGAGMALAPLLSTAVRTDNSSSQPRKTEATRPLSETRR